MIRGGYGIYTGSVKVGVQYTVGKINGSDTPGTIYLMLALPQTDPNSFEIYRTLLNQNIIGTRIITSEDVEPLGIIPGPGKPWEMRFRLDPNYRNPYTQQASLGIQRSLGGDYSLEVSYLFTRGLHIHRNRDVNQFKQTGPVDPYSGSPSFIRFPDESGQTTDFRNPLILQDNVCESTANSFYHAGILHLTKRYSKNYSMDINYTLSKAIDEVTDFNSYFSAQNPLNVRLDRGLSAFDQQHRLVFNGIYESSVKGDSVWARLLRNWTVSTIFMARSGRPFNLLLGFDANNDGYYATDRPNRAGRNTGRGEPYYNVDLRLTRRINLGESKRFDFTFEAFNIFNRTNYTTINNVVGTMPLEHNNPRGIEGLPPTAPLAFTDAAPARQLQLGARFTF